MIDHDTTPDHTTNPNPLVRIGQGEYIQDWTPVPFSRRTARRIDLGLAAGLLFASAGLAAWMMYHAAQWYLAFSVWVHNPFIGK